MNYFNKGVIITTKKKEKLYGIIIEEILNDENQIVAWQFVPNRKAIEFQKTQDKKLVEKVNHKDILAIELQ
jgi:hypothetical protein